VFADSLVNFPYNSAGDSEQIITQSPPCLASLALAKEQIFLLKEILAAAQPVGQFRLAKVR